MKSKNLSSVMSKAVLMATLVITFAWAPSGMAQDGQIRYFCEIVNDQWDQGGNWCTDVNCLTGCGTVPEPVDDAIIKADKTCILDVTDEVETITVQSGATLCIDGGTLILNEDDDECSGESICAISDFDGSLELDGEIHIDIGDGTDDLHTFTGSGDVEGLSSAAKILIGGNSVSSPDVLAISTLVHGILTFDNLDLSVAQLLLKNGTIHADAGGVMKIATDQLDDAAGTGGSLLKASTNASAELLIDLNCTGAQCILFCLEYTEWEILKGTAVIRDPIHNKGGLLMQPGGTLTVDNGIRFEIVDCESLFCCDDTDECSSE